MNVSVFSDHAESSRVLCHDGVVFGKDYQGFMPVTFSVFDPENDTHSPSCCALGFRSIMFIVVAPIYLVMGLFLVFLGAIGMCVDWIFGCYMFSEYFASGTNMLSNTYYWVRDTVWFRCCCVSSKKNSSV